MSMKVPSVFTSLVGRFSWMFPGNKKDTAVVAMPVTPWPTGAEKVLITLSQSLVLRDAETRTPVNVTPGGYVAIRQPDGNYGFFFGKGIVSAPEKFWAERVELGFVTVAGAG